MDRFLEAYVRWVRRILPSPLSIALILSLFTVLLILSFGSEGVANLKFVQTVWSQGIWDAGLLVFAFQMMLMLVLGHILALSPIMSKWIDYLVKPCDNTSKSAAIVSFFTILVALFNWGLGLIFGAIIARKVGEKAVKENRKINYPLVGAAGYVGLMVWHGGLSGSSIIKAAEPGHLKALMGANYLLDLPVSISMKQTVLSSMNLSATAALLVLIPASLYFIGSRIKVGNLDLDPISDTTPKPNEIVGVEHLDYSKWFGRLGGLTILFICLSIIRDNGFFAFFTPNQINLLLLGLGLTLHQGINSFTQALDHAIKGASGILIQFPLYFGILALMRESGAVTAVSDLFVHISTETTYPFFTFLSAGLVNIFVPSGGGQWAIQGPIIISSAQALGVTLEKGILALAYGDQLTNMLQPFWALPLLGITGLKAKDILPYTLLMFLIGCLIFSAVLFLF
jgi:short-chain fatty acids transporter